jgi:predicted dehydrogenase
MLNVGVIGLGRLGKKHALTIGGAVANARLTAVCDPVASLMDDVRGQFPGAKAFKSPQKMINSSDVDAVVLLQRQIPIQSF